LKGEINEIKLTLTKQTIVNYIWRASREGSVVIESAGPHFAIDAGEKGDEEL